MFPLELRRRKSNQTKNPEFQQRAIDDPTPKSDGARPAETSMDSHEEQDNVEAKYGQLSDIEIRGDITKFFKDRGISLDTLNSAGVKALKSSSKSQIEDTIAFVYYDTDRKPQNIKFRRIKEKRFYQCKGGNKIMYGLDTIRNIRENKGECYPNYIPPYVVIVEGEMDKLSLDEAKIPFGLSVPDGAPAQVSEPGTQSKKFDYLGDIQLLFERVSRVILATDADQPGEALAEELARRIGKHKCYRVKWPEGVKDANDMLLTYGGDELMKCLENAEEYPVEGLQRLDKYWKEVDLFFNMETNNEMRGLSTGWRNLDPYYKIIPGELTVVTGVPNSGKSEFLDAIMVNLSEENGWTFALCSMENSVRDHARKLIEKRVRKPFFDVFRPPGYQGTVTHSGMIKRMEWEEFDTAKNWINERFCLIRKENDSLPSVDWVIDAARAAVLRYGIRGLVIDPYNELDHHRSASMSETEYVSQILTKIKSFARSHGVHVWFVAHPRQIQDYKDKPPNIYDISGSAHFVNKADNVVVVHRNSEENSVQILIRKVRNKVAGTKGEANLSYDRVTGRYSNL